MYIVTHGLVLQLIFLYHDLSQGFAAINPPTIDGALHGSRFDAQVEDPPGWTTAHSAQSLLPRELTASRTAGNEDVRT